MKKNNRICKFSYKIVKMKFKLRMKLIARFKMNCTKKYLNYRNKMKRCNKCYKFNLNQKKIIKIKKIIVFRKNNRVIRN